MKLKLRTCLLNAAYGIMMLLNQDVSAHNLNLAGITFSESEAPAIRPELLIKPNTKPQNQKNQWHELHGSLNNTYVYLLLKKTGKRDVTGYLFDKKGNKRYVYGEWFDRNLQIYDQSNQRLNIILHQ